MSIVAPTHTFVHSIPIQRRLREIMKDKGGAFTITALSSRIGINRETLRKMLTGEREIYTFELEKIAKEMNLSVARILQEDVQAVVKELDTLLDGSFDLEHGLQLANHFLSLAVGMTEKCEAHVYMGKVLFQSRKYEFAHQHRLEAYDLAKVIKDTYGESNRYEISLRHLLTSFTVRKDYTNAYSMIELAKDFLDDKPLRLGGIYYSLAMIAYESSRLEEAKDQLYQSLHYYNQTSDTREIGKALHNVAFIEYKLKKYEKAKELFDQSISTLESFPKNRLIAIKDYVKVLHRLGCKIEAIRLIEEGLHESYLVQIPDLEAQFRLLYSIYTDSVSVAVTILESSGVSDKLKLTACKVLMDYFTRHGESEMLMKYYIIARQFTISDDDQFGEEDL